MIIAIDDSGDPGLNPGKGASTHFVIAAISFEDDFDAEEAALKIKRYRRDLHWANAHEFKFRKTSSEIKREFFSIIKGLNFRTSIVLLDKEKIDKDEFRKDPSKLYNATILKALTSLRAKPDHAHIYIDGEGGRGYRHKVKTYFRQNLPKNSIKELTYRNSQNDNLIQLADMIAGAARYSVSGRTDANNYLKTTRRHIDTIATNL